MNVRSGIFDGSQIRALFNDKNFRSTMKTAEIETWNAFADVASNFLRSVKAENYINLVTLLKEYEALGCNIVKVHFLHSHVKYFLANLDEMSEEQGERFHQDTKTMEKRYQGRWNVNMMADYCWCLQRDSDSSNLTRKTLKRKFVP